MHSSVRVSSKKKRSQTAPKQRSKWNKRPVETNFDRKVSDLLKTSLTKAQEEEKGFQMASDVHMLNLPQADNDAMSSNASALDVGEELQPVDAAPKPENPEAIKEEDTAAEVAGNASANKKRALFN